MIKKLKYILLIVGVIIGFVASYANIPAFADTIKSLPQYIITKDEGTQLTAKTTSIDYVGSGVTATNVGGAVTVTVSGGGGGTPGGADTQIQFNDAGAFGGDTYFSWDKTGNILNLGLENDTGKLHGVTATSANTTGGSLSFVTGNGLGSGNGGQFEIVGGDGGATGNGGNIHIFGGTGGATLGNAGGIVISGADAQLGTGGNGGGILFEIGAADGGGTNGYYGFTNLGGIIQTLNFDSVINPNTYTFPDLSGTVALLNNTGLGVVKVDNLDIALNTVKGLSGLNFINNVGDLYKFRSFTGAGVDAILDTSLVATSDKTYTLQNASGTLAFLSDIVLPTLTSTYIGVGNGSNLLSGSSAFTYASGRITNTATTEQLRLGYDASNYLSHTISSNGTTTYAITSSSGTPTFNFNKETIVDLGTIPYVGQYAHRIMATDVLFGGTYEVTTNFGYNYTTQYWSAQSRNPGIIEFDGGTQSFSFRSGNGGYTDIFGYNKLDLRTLAGQNIRIMNGSTVNIQVTTGGNVELQDSVKLLTYGSGTHSGTATYTLQVDASGNIIEGSPSGGSGILRSVNVISTNTTAGATSTTDYVYIVSGTTTLTLPTAVGNTNRYTVKRTDATLTTTIATTSSQTIDGASTYTLTSQYESVDLISNGSNWLTI